MRITNEGIKEEINRFLNSEICTEREAGKIKRYYELLMCFNDRVNLISTRSGEDFLRSHILDSISPLRWGLIERGGVLCDIGSGGGLPGVPIKLMIDEIEVELVESKRKRARALDEIISGMGIDRAVVRNQRAEMMAKSGAGGKFDYVTVRAVGETEKVLKTALPLMKRGGRLIAYKTETDEVDREFIEKKGAFIVDYYDYELAGKRKKRRLQVIEKA